MYQLYRIDEALCTGCGACVDACPAEAIALVDGRAWIDDATCIDCGRCVRACPQGAIMMIDTVSSAYPTLQPQTNLMPIAPMMTSAEAVSLTHQPDAQVLPAEPQRRRFWPMVGGALVWAARELLPEVLTAWRSSRAGATRPGGRQSAGHTATSVQIASQQPRAGHRHRWGRA